MAARKKKREQGSYHASDAARVARISAKLLGKDKEEGDVDEAMEAEGGEAEEDAKMECECSSFVIPRDCPC